MISITDGQIFLEADLFNKGIRPAINVGNSVSRVGSAAQTKAMKKVSGKIKLELAQFRELEAFMQFSQDLDPETKARIESGRRMVEVLKQGKGAPLSMERQVVIIYAAIKEFLKTVPVDRIGDLEEKLFSYIETKQPKLFSTIAKERDISEATDKMLTETLASFKASHSDLFLENQGTK